MKRLGLIQFFAFFVALTALLSGPSAEASVLSSRLTFDGIPDTIEDDSRSEFVNVDGSVDAFGSPTVTLGDIAYGFISVSDFVPGGTANPDEIATVFSVIVGPPTVSGAGFTLLPTAPASPFSLNSLLGLPLVSPVTPAGSIGVVVDLSGVNPLVPEVADPAGAGALGAPFPGIWELTVGLSWFGGVPDSTGAVNPADFFEIVPGAGSALFPRFERAGLSVLAFGAFPTVSLIPVPVVHLDPLGLLTSHDVVLFSGNITPNPLAPPGGASTWTFVDDSDFLVNPPVIPEPGSILIWGLGLTIAAGLATGRRRPFAG